MKFMVGYQLVPNGILIDCMLRHCGLIHEVYFAWGDLPNGRGLQAEATDGISFEDQTRQLIELEELSQAGIGLNLLLNGNCYGGQSLARSFYNKLGDTVDFLSRKINLRSVTTTSPVIARFVRENFPALRRRASINMEIGSIQGMDYLAEYFDGYYMQRELNRNLPAIKQLKQWCDANGKELYLLANSGCLNHCSAHNFHDNLVAHEHEIMAMDNAFTFRGICHDYLRRPGKQLSIVRDTNYVRPEDLRLYEPYFTAVKLATRINRNPVAVIEAYVRRNYSGNLPDLLEPNHAESFYPWILENSRFPADFAKTVMNCRKNCETCTFCKDVFEQIKIKLNTEDNPSC